MEYVSNKCPETIRELTQDEKGRNFSIQFQTIRFMTKVMEEARLWLG